MKKQDEMKKRLITGSDDLRNDLLEWAGKLKALGHMLSALAWNESKPDSGTIALEQHGEILGDIIMDYAEFIETAVSEDKTIRFPFKFHEQTLKWIVDSNGEGGSAGVINTHLMMIDDFLKKTAHPAYQMRNRFEDLKKQFSVSQESTQKVGSAKAK